jgi:hypothetical protein
MSSSQPNTEGSSDGFVYGGFKRDEPEETLVQVKASKKTILRVWGSQNNQPGTQLEAGGVGGSLTTRRTAAVCHFFILYNYGMS